MCLHFNIYEQENSIIGSPEPETRSILKKIIVEGYRAVGSLNDSFQSSNFLLLVFFIAFGQW